MSYKTQIFKYFSSFLYYNKNINVSAITLNWDYLSFMSHRRCALFVFFCVFFFYLLISIISLSKCRRTSFFFSSVVGSKISK
jgi:TRAP-type C4-dicarboxylate transport system permease small subunit